MSVTFRGYAGDVVILNGEKLFYTLDPAAKGNLWNNLDRFIPINIVPREAYCWWLDSNDNVTYYDGRRRMI